MSGFSQNFGRAELSATYLAAAITGCPIGLDLLAHGSQELNPLCCVVRNGPHSGGESWLDLAVPMACAVEKGNTQKLSVMSNCGVCTLFGVQSAYAKHKHHVCLKVQLKFRSL